MSPDLLLLCVSLDLRFSGVSATTCLPGPCKASFVLSRLFFSLDDELFRFFLLERPKLKHQHIATKIRVSDRYAPTVLKVGRMVNLCM